MEREALPVKKVTVFTDNLPSLWQTVIFRNFGLVPNDKIAKVICTDEATVIKEAKRLGLDGITYNSDWLDCGFVTIIRNNWELLDYAGLCTLTGKSADELNELIDNYDFLGVKLGGFKPQAGDYKYSPLTPEQENKTAEIYKIVTRERMKPQAEPFDFFARHVNATCTLPTKLAVTDRYVYGYCAPYGDVLADSELPGYDEEYLKRLAATGTNGIWLHDILYKLSPFELMPELSKGYEKRCANLKKLTQRCGKYGIKVYLYLNEPRGMAASFFEGREHLKGQSYDGGYCMCTSAPQVKKYIYDGIKYLAKNVPELGGIMTITMSENPTHCHYKSMDTDCPYCKQTQPEEAAAEINNIMAKAVSDSGSKTRVIANLWGWSEFMGWSKERTKRGIDLLDKSVDVMLVSEYGKKFTLGGVDSEVIDYSISKVGPGDFAVEMLDYAKNKGHRVWAKTQANVSWELSALPYIPCFGLMCEHIRNLVKIGVSGLMLGWSLGGFPGGALPLCNAACGKDFDFNAKMREIYGADSDNIITADGEFCEAFKEFPFSIDSLYFGAQTLGVGNLWRICNSGRESSMVCFSFDDFKWCAPYGIEIYLSQYGKLTSRWEKAINLLGSVKTAAGKEYALMANAAYVHFKSAQNFAEFCKLKKDVAANRERLIQISECEYALTQKMLDYTFKDARIGYEVTNHYFYNQNLLLEKLVNLKNIIGELS